jgi:hypothetical protein
MNDFFNTSAVGKGVRAILFVVVSAGLTAVVPLLQSNPDLAGGFVYAGIVIAVVNGLLVFIKGYADPKTPTLPQ